MKALAIRPQVLNSLRIVERPEPAVTVPSEIKLQVLQVGICGTDREEAAGMRADAPAGSNELVIGHEMFGRIVEVGESVRTVAPGDYATFTVRRSCGHCRPCMAGRNDMCESGDYTERGIKGRDGYQTEFVVDDEQYIVRIPDSLSPIGVLAEPLSIVEKALDEAATLQCARLPYINSASEWFSSVQALVAGLGPVGLLAVVALRLRGARVIGLDVVDETSPRAALLKEFGGTYIDGRTSQPHDLFRTVGQIDLIFEATGVAALEFDLLATLGINGVYVVTGIPGGSRMVDIDGAALMRQLVLGNQIVIGSVNASRKHFELAVADLDKAMKLANSPLQRIITHRFSYTRFDEALFHHAADEIKAVVEWA